MSLSVLRSRALAGMEALPVSVEVHLANGLPSFTMVGMNTPKDWRKTDQRAVLGLHQPLPIRGVPRGPLWDHDRSFDLHGCLLD